MTGGRVTDSLLSAMAGCTRELDQVLGLLAGAGVAKPEDLTVGQGDRMLLEMLWQLSGGPLRVTLTCPACSGVSVVEVDPTRLPPGHARCAWLGPGGGLREPTYADLTGLPDDRRLAGEELLRRCTVGRPPRPASLEDLERVEQSLGPILAECFECGQPIESSVEVVQLVLGQLARRAQDVDLEVHLLARAYGWDLGTIEALPDDRRRRLAGFVAGGR